MSDISDTQPPITKMQAVETATTFRSVTRPRLRLAAVAGLALPKCTFALEVFYMLGRLLFSIGYYRDPNKRSVGAVICDIGFLGMFGIGVYGCLIKGGVI